MMECISHRHKLAMKGVDNKVKHADTKSSEANEKKKEQ